MSDGIGEIAQERWAGGQLERVEACPVCGAGERTSHARDVTDHLMPSSADRWNVYRCGFCRSLYLDPRPTAESLGFAYRSYYTHEGAQASGREQGYVWALIHGYMNRRFGVSLRPSMLIGNWLFALVEPFRLKLDYHGRHLFMARKAGGGKLLDVGCGNGEFLRRAIEMGWIVAGLDPDPSAVAACREAGIEAFEGSITDVDPVKRYDVVTLRHSIEHVAIPMLDLVQCRQRLRPGGMIWLAWPNPESIGARLFGAAWRGLEVPRHLCIPTVQAMRKLLCEAGFTNVRAVRRGHHASGIMRESRLIAKRGGGWRNRFRAIIAPAVACTADMLATFGVSLGEELVMVAWVPADEGVVVGS